MTALSIKTAAARLDVSEDTIRKAVSEQGLPAYRIGRSIRIHADDLDEWFRNLARVGGEDA